jgi:MFS family permease
VTTTAIEREQYPVKKIIFAAGLGTMIEWYDFYIFGSLALIMSEVFFPKGDPVWALIKTWALFATGFIVRPFGAIVFGRVGDLIGRKYAFLVTICRDTPPSACSRRRSC